MNQLFAIITFIISYYILTLISIKLLKIDLDWHIPVTIVSITSVLSLLSFIFNLPLTLISFIIIIYLLKYIQEQDWKDTIIISFIPFFIAFLPIIIVILI